MYSRDHRTLFFLSQLSKRTCSSFLFFIDNLLFLKIYMELRSKSGFIKGGVRFTKKVVKQTWEKQCLKDIVEWGGDFSYPLIIPVFLFFFFFFNLVNVLYPLKVGHQSPFMKNQSAKNPLWLKFWLWGSMSDPNMFHVLSGYFVTYEMAIFLLWENKPRSLSWGDQWKQSSTLLSHSCPPPSTSDTIYRRSGNLWVHF